MDAFSFNTPTVAELFVAQGKPARAMGILRAVVRQNPADRLAAARLAELENTLAAADATAAQVPGEAMIFREHMQLLVDAVPGATACTLMGFDGIAIDSYEIGGHTLDIPVLLAEYSAATAALRQSGQEQPLAGTVQEWQIATTHLTALIQVLTPEYFLAMVLNSDGLCGKARFLMRQAAPQFIAELG